MAAWKAGSLCIPPKTLRRQKLAVHSILCLYIRFLRSIRQDLSREQALHWGCADESCWAKPHEYAPRLLIRAQLSCGCEERLKIERDLSSLECESKALLLHPRDYETTSRIQSNVRHTKQVCCLHINVYPTPH